MNKREMDRTKKRILADMRKLTANIARERDQLRDLFDELAEIMDTTEEGLRDIEYGIDRLSEQL